MLSKVRYRLDREQRDWLRWFRLLLLRKCLVEVIAAGLNDCWKLDGYRSRCYFAVGSTLSFPSWKGTLHIYI